MIMGVRSFAKVIEPEQQTHHLMNHLLNQGHGSTFVFESDRTRTAKSSLSESLAESWSWEFSEKYAKCRKTANAVKPDSMYMG